MVSRLNSWPGRLLRARECHLDPHLGKMMKNLTAKLLNNLAMMPVKPPFNNNGVLHRPARPRPADEMPQTRTQWLTSRKMGYLLLNRFHPDEERCETGAEKQHLRITTPTGVPRLCSERARRMETCGMSTAGRLTMSTGGFSHLTGTKITQ